jgi:hypothetical protein
MLNAIEARKIALATHENVVKILDKLDGQVREAAGAGKTFVLCEEADTYQFVDEGQSAPIETPLQARLINNLRELGYMVDIVPGTPYVSMGALEDTPNCVRYSVRIRW